MLLNCLLFLVGVGISSGSALGIAHRDVNFAVLSAGRVEASLTPKYRFVLMFSFCFQTERRFMSPFDYDRERFGGHRSKLFWNIIPFLVEYAKYLTNSALFSSAHSTELPTLLTIG